MTVDHQMTKGDKDNVIVSYSNNCYPYGAAVLSCIWKNIHSSKEEPIKFLLNDRLAGDTFELDGKRLNEVALLIDLCKKFCPNLLDIDSNIKLDDWLEFTALHKLAAEKTKCELPEKSFATMINNHLATRTFIVGHRLCLVDIVLYTNFKRHPDALKGQDLCHVRRWFGYISDIAGVEETMNRFSKIAINTKKPFTKEEQIDNSYKGALKNATQGKVVTRFAPEPSGYLHVGHTKAALLNMYFVKRYNGKYLLRFDDTNPVKETVEFEESIKEDLEMLGIKYDKTSHSSDHFDMLIELAKGLIKEGYAYCDDTEVETMRMQRTNGIPSEARNNSIETNLENFEEMLQGSAKGVKFCLRAKMDMQNPNKCLRDPVIYRCIVDIPHNRHGFKYKAYPTYDFACPIIDSVEGVTHALRASEYSARIPQYQWFIEKCKLRKVEIYEFSRINFVKTILSKRHLKWFVSNGLTTGWDDPRMPTVRGLIRRGLTKQALYEFILELGPSKAINLMEWDKLWTKNKQVIDPIAPRYAAVGTDGVKLTIVNYTKLDATTRPLHPKNLDVGTCDLHFFHEVLIDKADFDEIEDGEEITLMRWGNVFVDTKKLECKLNPGGDFKKTKKKLHWLPNNKEHLIPCTLKQYCELLAVDRIEGSELTTPQEAQSVLAPVTEWTMECLGDIIQLERRGYFIVDVPASEGMIVLFMIPADWFIKNNLNAYQCKMDTEVKENDIEIASFDDQESTRVSQDSFIECCLVNVPKFKSLTENTCLSKWYNTGNDSSNPVESELAKIVDEEIITTKDPQPLDLDANGVDILSARLNDLNCTVRTNTLYDEPIYDPEIVEKAAIIFTETILNLTNEAIDKAQIVLADKLIRSIFIKLDALYANGESKVSSPKRSSNGIHPILLVDTCPLINCYPNVVKQLLSQTAKDPKYINNFAQNLLATNLLDRFNITHLKSSIDSTQPLIQRIWNSCLDTVTFKLPTPTPSISPGRKSTLPLTLVEFSRCESVEDIPDDDDDSSLCAQGEEKKIVIRGFSSSRNRDKSKSTTMKSISLSPRNRSHRKYPQIASRIFTTRRTVFLKQHFKHIKIKTGDGWVKEPYRALETYYRYESDGSVSIKLRGKLPCEILKVLYIINETEYSVNWVPFLKEAHDVYNFSRTCKIFQQHFEYPIVGVKNTRVLGIAVNALEEANCLIIACRSPPENKNDVDNLSSVLKNGGIEDVSDIVSIKDGKCKIFDYHLEPQPKKQNQRAADLCFLLFPHGEEYTLMELYANVLPEVKLVPLRAISFIIKKVILGMFKKIVVLCKNIEGSKFAQKAEDSQNYMWMKQIYYNYRIHNPKPKCNVSICTYYPSNNDI
ncbi:bifunctional Ribosomal protein L25-Gln-tRNA synthetase [Babesia duncani]|uniref:glutamate--tRNA ligase n=1 Tax=Babesia duncani TaxID=323732 RepID=A0AAD9UQJ6_9APIC|nr:bifunctional Ribosomal protein L25-Gln-tRNA synthetase [Babesia duncani]